MTELLNTRSTPQETCADIGSPQSFAGGVGLVSFTPATSVTSGFFRVRWTANADFVIVSADAYLSTQ